jgi:DNA-binding protein H-NS
MKINALNSMSIDELWSLHEQIGYVLSSKMSEEKARLEKRLKQLTSAAPSRKTTRRPYPSVLPKFRNPVRPSETWAGRGKQPRWLRAQLQLGKQLNDFRTGVS